VWRFSLVLQQFEFSGIFYLAGVAIINAYLKVHQELPQKDG